MHVPAIILRFEVLLYFEQKKGSCMVWSLRIKLNYVIYSVYKKNWSTEPFQIQTRRMLRRSHWPVNRKQIVWIFLKNKRPFQKTYGTNL
jgi:hypothetical protein